MADEATSVGKIQLDIEISKSSLGKEMGGLNKAFGDGFKSSFNGIGNQMNGFIKNTIGRMANNFKDFAQVGNKSNQAVALSAENIGIKMENLIHQMDNAVNRAELYRQKLKDLEEQYSRLSDKQIGSEKGLKLGEQILIAKERVQKYGEVADRTRVKIEDLENAMSGLGQTASDSNKGFKKAEHGAKKTSRSFKDLGDQSSKSSRKVGGFGDMITGTFMRILKRIFIINLIYKAIRGLINYMNGALKTNKDFANSFNAIKTNLKVAFQPIYDFILPALNALMRTLATVTSYIASFMSALFGKTYKQSYDAAKGIDTAKKAMDGYGKSAKKAKGQLAGFDEINILDTAEGDSDSGGSSADEMTMPETTFDIVGAEGFRDLLADLFKPFKLAWENEGLNVINSAKYALESIKGVIEAIGKSWMEVWTGGTGQAIIENILRILQLVFSIVGDIANAFKIAWETNDLGTQLLQSIADMFLSILGLIETIGKSFREVWNNGTGVEIISNILGILKEVFDLIGNIADAFKNAWESNNVGTSIIQGIANILIIVLDTIKRIAKSTADWAKMLDFTPLLNSIDRLLQALAPLTQNIGDGLVWLWENALLPLAGWVIEDAIPVFLEMLAEAIGVLNNVIDALKPLGQWLWDNFLKPLAEWTGVVIISALEGIRDALKGIGDWVSDNQGVVQTMAIIVGGFAAAWGLVNIAIGAWNAIGVIATGVTTAFGAAIAFLTSPIGIAIAIIGSLIAVGVLLYKNWDEIKVFGTKIWGEIKRDLTKTWEDTKKMAGDIWNGLAEFFKKTWEGIKSSATTIFTNIKSTISTIFNGIKTTTSTIWNGITGGLKTSFDTIYNNSVTIFNKMKTFIKGITDSIEGFFKGMVNGVIRALNTMISGLNRLKVDIPDWVPGIGGKGLGFNIPNIPMLAKGGIVDQPTLAMVGERGKEAVMPLENNTGWITDLATKIVALMGGSGSNNESGGDTTIIIKIGEDTLLEYIIDAINRQNRIKGETVITILRRYNNADN